MHCIFDFQTKKCKEEYISCATYKTVSGSLTSQTICENISLYDFTKKCVYKSETKNCVEERKNCEDYQSYEPKTYCPGIPASSNIKSCKLINSECVEDYRDCTSYSGKDKKICESIKDNDFKCILTHDLNCVKKKLLTCSEATSSTCSSYYALPEDGDTNKQCIFVNGKCIESYKECEYFIGHLRQTCESIIKIDGKKCVFESSTCKTYDKLCSEGITQSECEHISKISDRDNKICAYDSASGSCFENYKYCSDYRGTDKTICEKIEPYSTTGGTGKDAISVCVYDDKIGCHRRLLECSEANNEALCESISSELARISKYYCLYINGKCTEQYKTCEDYDKNVEKDVCQAIIPTNSINHHCVFKTVGQENKCVSELKKCESLILDDYEYYCNSINPFCSYSEGVCSTTTKSCSEMKFYEASSSNSVYCNSITLADTNKICALSSDQLKCEEKDKPKNEESSQTSSNSGTSNQSTQSQSQSNQGNSSSEFLKSKGAKVIFAFLLCLL